MNSMPVRDFEQNYQNDKDSPPWEIGHPQPTVTELTQQGYISGNVLDCGCGTGENTLYLASLGYQVLGIDSAPTAIARAQSKAQQRGSMAVFQQADAFNLDQLGQHFNTVLDSALMHNFPDPEIMRYIQSLSSAITPNGRLILLCFSEATIGQSGPLRRFSQADIRTFFQQGWHIEEIRSALYETLFNPPQAAAWLTIIRRVVE